MDFYCESYQTHNGIRHVIRDDCLFAGTKQRVVVEFFRETLSPDVTTLLYSSSYNGYGPVATAFAARELGLKCILILSRKGFGKPKRSSRKEVNKSLTVLKCKQLGAKIIIVDNWFQLNLLAESLKSNKIYWVPLGFKDPFFEYLLTEEMKRLKKLRIKRIWVVGGTGILARSICNALPKATVFLVPTDKNSNSFPKLVDFVIPFERIKIITSDCPVLKTPYPTIQGYDSKAWDCSVELGEPGDFVWNVASC